MLTAIPLQIFLSLRETEEWYLPAETIVDRIVRSFPHAEVDWQRGKAEAESNLKRLTAMGTPELILLGARDLVDKTVYVRIDFPEYPENYVYAFVTGVERELGSLSFLAKVFDMDLLKYAAEQISSALNFHFVLQTPWWGLEVATRPGAHDPWKFARLYYPRENYHTLTMTEIPDWKVTVPRAVVFYMRHSVDRKGVEQSTEGFTSYEEYAEQTLRELAAISPIQRCWIVRAAKAPCSNDLILDHGNWMTRCSLSGVALEDIS